MVKEGVTGIIVPITVIISTISPEPKNNPHPFLIIIYYSYSSSSSSSYYYYYYPPVMIPIECGTQDKHVFQVSVSFLLHMGLNVDWVLHTRR